MSEQQVRQMFDRASQFCEVHFAKRGEIAPMWHAVTSDSEELFEQHPDFFGKDTSGDRTILGSISRRGNRYLRTLFVQAAWVVLVKVGPKHWDRYGLQSWIEAAKKRLHHNVLAIAHGASTSRAVSGFPRGYISPNFKVLTSNIPAREHRTPTHGRRERY
jgi:hypothetical protein